MECNVTFEENNQKIIFTFYEEDQILKVKTSFDPEITDPKQVMPDLLSFLSDKFMSALYREELNQSDEQN